jgi:hypothetical protein
MDQAAFITAYLLSKSSNFFYVDLETLIPLGLQSKISERLLFATNDPK